MAKPKQLPSGSWRALVYAGKDDKGKRLYESITAPTEKECNYAVLEYQLKKKGRSRPENITLGEAMDRYINSNSNVFSPTTIREYTRSRKRDLQGLMNIKLEEITQERIQQEINQEAKTHSPKSVRNMHGLLSAVLDIYLPDFRLRTKLPQKVEPDIYVPSDDEIQKLITNIRGTELYKAVLLAAFGSLRRSEICALLSTDIADNCIYVSKAMVLDIHRQWVVKSTKTTASKRVVAFSDSIIHEFDGVQGRIVDLNPDQITKQFRIALRDSGVNHFKFHSLRHYQASILHAMGVPDKYIMERGGWKTSSTLNKVYKHTMDAKQKEVNSVINNHFDNLMQHEMQHENRK